MTKTAQLLIVSFTIILSSCSDNKANKTPETEMEKVSYSLGVNVATGVKAQGLDTIDANVEGLPIPICSISLTSDASVYLGFALEKDSLEPISTKVNESFLLTSGKSLSSEDM